MAQNENISLSLTNKIDILNKTQSLDARYGVYDTEEDALEAMADYGLDGRQVTVYSDKVNGKVKLYLYNKVKHQLEPISSEEDVEGDKYFIYEKTTPSTIWLIDHPLNKKVSVTVTDSAGTVIEGQITLNTGTQVEIKFNAPFWGYAYLN